MSRLLAIDFGKARSGIAVTDELQLIASGLTTVATRDLLQTLKDYTAKEDVSTIIVGEPKNMDNTPSEAEEHIKPFLKALGAALPHIPVERQDERFTSKLAVQSMVQGGMKKKKRQNKALVDEISATLILQAYLNRK